MIGSAGITAAGVLVVIFGVVVGIGVYMLPTIIGSIRKVVNVGSVFAVNLLLGWTLIGWAVALAMALRTNPPYAYPPHAYPQAQQYPPQNGPPPDWYPDPQGGPNLRWWNGTQWTEHTK